MDSVKKCNACRHNSKYSAVELQLEMGFVYENMSFVVDPKNVQVAVYLIFLPSRLGLVVVDIPFHILIN